MLIKFREGDPRAGLVVRMDSSLGQQMVDLGAAERVTEGGGAALGELESPVNIELQPPKPKAARGKK